MIPNVKIPVIAAKLCHVSATGFKKLLSAHTKIQMYYADTFKQAVTLLRQHPQPILLLPDTVVIEEGGNCIMLIKRNLPPVRIVLYVSPLLQNPAGYIAKGGDGLISATAPFREFTSVILQVANGNSPVCCSQMKLLINPKINYSSNRFLKPVHEQILLMHMNGFKRPAIAEKVGLTDNTITDYRNDAYALLEKQAISAADYIKKFDL